MSPRHHPTSETLDLYSAGALSPGAALGVASHLDACRTCRTHGSATLSEEPTHAAPRALAAHSDPLQHTLSNQPEARLGPWRWAGPGLRLAHLLGAAGLGERVYVIEGRPGARLAAHSHDGAEYVTVLQGRFNEGGEAFEVGDFCEHDGADCTHRLRVIGPDTCICLVVTDAPLRLAGSARLLQHWLGV